MITHCSGTSGTGTQISETLMCSRVLSSNLVVAQLPPYPLTPTTTQSPPESPWILCYPTALPSDSHPSPARMSLVKLSSVSFITIRPISIGPCPSRPLYYSCRSFDRIHLNDYPYHCVLLPGKYTEHVCTPPKFLGVHIGSANIDFSHRNLPH